MASQHRLDDAVDWFRKSFRSEAAEGLRARYELRLTGPSGGSVSVQVADGTARVEPCEAPDADVRMRISLDDWFAVLEGRENVDLLYMAGRLEIDGDLSLAVKLRTLFRPA